MVTAPHRIRKQRWVVSTYSAADAFAWRKLLYDQGQDMLLQLLERVFDEAADEDEIVHIPRIELNVKVHAEEQLQEELPDMILQQLREQVLNACRTSRGSAPGGKRVARENRFDSLILHLRSGLVPWQVASAHELAEICREQRQALLQYVLNRNESDAFYFRLLHLIPEEERRSFMDNVTDTISQPLKTAVSDVMTVLSGEAGVQRLTPYTRLLLAAQALSACIRQKDGPEGRGLLTSFMHGVPSEEQEIVYDLLSSLPNTVLTLLQKAQGWSRDSGVSPFCGQSPDDETPESDVPRCSEKDAPAGIFLDNINLSTDLPVAESLSDRAGDEALFPLRVNHAGLVALHPFIPTLFNSTGIVQKGSTQIRSFTRASALLHYLATGREDVYEYELGFIKVLLGLQPDTPVPVCAGLVKQEDTEEAEALITSALRHWSALKNTSIQGFRSSFLERQGLLRRGGSGWRLQVERKPFDALLEYLPWSISVVKLPWMKETISAEW